MTTSMSYEAGTPPGSMWFYIVGLHPQSPSPTSGALALHLCVDHPLGFPAA